MKYILYEKKTKDGQFEPNYNIISFKKYGQALKRSVELRMQNANNPYYDVDIFACSSSVAKKHDWKVFQKGKYGGFF